eukprot:GEMP01025272.1.p1 GENE.GEMP01025272.1~~GEMP01025272.1.p1  ORF type:complete len:147 (+),score=34.44 GEMP01025272.1:529-969(+)
MLHYIYIKTKKTRKHKSTHLLKWAPCYLILASIFLVLADLTRHLVNDAWGIQNCKKDLPPPSPPPANFKYVICESHQVATEYLSDGSLSAYGWGLTIFCTWTGFLCMVTGVLWGIGLPRKIQAQWRTHRRNNSREAPLLTAGDDQA